MNLGQRIASNPLMTARDERLLVLGAAERGFPVLASHVLDRLVRDPPDQPFPHPGCPILVLYGLPQVQLRYRSNTG